MRRKKTTGLVLGKFMPLHRGHELLIHFARKFVDRLFIVVDNVPEERYEKEYIPGHIRTAWVQKTCPHAEVFYLPHINPQDPSEHKNFWQIWKKSLLDLVPTRPDFLFASEEYGFPLAHVLGSVFIPLDIDRQTIKMSAKKIRTDFHTYWEYLSDAARPDFTMRVCICGPESAGKSTLAKELSKYFKTLCVPEYARSYLETHIKKTYQEKTKYTISLNDMFPIAKGQVALEDALVRHANRLLISDTDALATTLWSTWLFRKCNKDVQELAKNQKQDLYILVKPDIGWKKDAIRYTPEEKTRKIFFKEYEEMLISNKSTYVVIGGKGIQRTKKAIEAVENFMKKNFTYRYFVEKLRE